MSGHGPACLCRGVGAFGVQALRAISAERVSLCSNARDPFSAVAQPLCSSWAMWQSFLSMKPSLPMSWRRLCSSSAAFCSLGVSLHSWEVLLGMPGCVPGLHPVNRGWDRCRVPGSLLSPTPGKGGPGPLPHHPQLPLSGLCCEQHQRGKAFTWHSWMVWVWFWQELIPAWSCLRGYFQRRGRVCFLSVTYACLSPCLANDPMSGKGELCTERARVGVSVRPCHAQQDGCAQHPSLGTPGQSSVALLVPVQRVYEGLWMPWAQCYPGFNQQELPG